LKDVAIPNPAIIIQFPGTICRTLSGSASGLSVDVPINQIASASIEIDLESNGYNEFLDEYAEVYLQLSPDLYAAWEEGGGLASGLEEKEKNNFLVSSDKIEFKNLNLANATDSSFIQLTVNYLSSEIPVDNKFEIDVMLKSDDAIVHGNRITSFRNPDRQLDATAKVKESTLNTVTLEAIPLNEPAAYNWYDESGNQVGEGQQIQVGNRTTQTYTLEVIAENDGYKDYDDVKVVVEDAIKSITPNPASNQITVAYKLTGEQPSGTIRIGNIYGLEVKNMPVTNNTTFQVIYIGDLLLGNYIVSLFANEAIIGSKILIKE
jgi:hypothetical protein